MASAENSKSNKSSSNRSASGKSSGTRHSLDDGGNGRSQSKTWSGMASIQNAPPWATTLASVVGAGVALGVGLFATRRQWMPYAENLNESLHNRLDQQRKSEATYEDDIHASEANWASSEIAATANANRDATLAAASMP